MTEAQQEPGQLMDIGTVAAHNIASALGLGEEKVAEIRHAIRDEISAMSSHFTMAVADVQTHFEIQGKTLVAEKDAAVAKLKAAYDADVAAIKADYSFVLEHKAQVIAVLVVVLSLGLVIGKAFL